MVTDRPFDMRVGVGPTSEEGWAEETQRYVGNARPKSTFKTVLDAHLLFGGGGTTEVRTRLRHPRDGEIALSLNVAHELAGQRLEEELDCSWGDGLRARRLVRTLGQSRREEIDFDKSPWPLPPSTYPDVLLPFLLRWQPRDASRRATYAWTCDRFIARVYYETRGTGRLKVPAGSFEAAEVWMYPDLNDWIPLGSIVTALTKPFLPRYTLWYEVAAPHRLLKFEGAYGPPGSPEVILHLVE